MTDKRFFVQPDWLDFCIFWALIVSGVALAVIIQMEVVGYGIPNLVASRLLVAVLLVAAVQVLRARLIVGAGGITVRRLSPANTLHFAAADLLGVAHTAHTVSLTTRQYGRIRLVHLGKTAKLCAALAAVQAASQDGAHRQEGVSHV
ncbi:EbsA family protein [Lacticaseibacillus kribbianus]|uniref:EbsA family protein n=1 Tax=Lacticaseibacillus kribbianus TaxID=2926292 RepID=UPI001CD3E95D